MVLALAAAPLVRANVPATYLGTAVINPVTGRCFISGSCGSGAGWWAAAAALGELVALDGAGWWALFKELLGPFLVGAAVAIPTLAGLSFVLVHALVRGWQRRARRRPAS
jgi:uncharacterized protein (DUF2062 family)